jgi:hypothetical protein
MDDPQPRHGGVFVGQRQGMKMVAAGQRVGASGKTGVCEAVVGFDSGTGMPLRGNSRVSIDGRSLGPTDARKHCPPPDEKAVYTSCSLRMSS